MNTIDKLELQRLDDLAKRMRVLLLRTGRMIDGLTSIEKGCGDLRDHLSVSQIELLKLVNECVKRRHELKKGTGRCLTTQAADHTGAQAAQNPEG